MDAPDVNSGNENEKKGNLGFIHAFIASISVIIVSELGDKTFFIAAIMAMRHPRLTVFLGAISALGLMTVLSGKSLQMKLDDNTEHFIMCVLKEDYSVFCAWLLHSSTSII